MSKEERKPHQKPQPSLKLYRRIATLFVLLTIGMVSFAAYVVFSRAHIVILSEPIATSGEFIVDIAKDPVQREVQGIAYEDTVSATETFDVGSVVTVDAHAEGRVRINSSLSRSQTLIPTTRLLTPDGILFRLKDRVVVPANGSVEVDAFADEIGTEGDVGEATFTIPGLNETTRRFFQVETVTPMAGGIREVKMVTAEDISDAVKTLTMRIERELTNTFYGSALEEGISTSGRFVTIREEKREMDVEPGEEVDTFTMTLTMSGQAVFYDEAIFHTRVAAALADRLSFDRQLKEVNRDSIEVEVEKVDILGGRANLRVHATGTSVISTEAPLLDPEKIAGVSVEAATTYLQSIDGVSSASVNVKPFWARKVPDLVDHITVEVR